MKKFFYLFIAALALCTGCGEQNPPSVGESGTSTPVDNPNGQDMPTDAGLTITYERLDNRTYTFTARNAAPAPNPTVKWEITNPGGQKETIYGGLNQPLTYHFEGAGKATVTAYGYDAAGIIFTLTATIYVMIF